jgi:hypothetical protein
VRIFNGQDPAITLMEMERDERIEHRVDGLEHGDVLHEGRVPHEAEDEGADENGQHEHEKLLQDIILVFGLDEIVEHLLHTDIFFLGTL